MIKYIAIILLAFSGSAFSASDPVIESDISMQALLKMCKSDNPFEKGYWAGFLTVSVKPVWR